jgi:hypothetical protein
MGVVNGSLRRLMAIVIDIATAIVTATTVTATTKSKLWASTPGWDSAPNEGEWGWNPKSASANFESRRDILNHFSCAGRTCFDRINSVEYRSCFFWF